MASYYQKLSNDVNRIEEESIPKIPPNVYYAVKIPIALSVADIKALDEEDFLAAYITPKQTLVFFYPHEGKDGISEHRQTTHHRLCSTFASKFKTQVSVVVIGSRQKLVSYITYYVNKTQQDFYLTSSKGGLTRKDAETLTVAEIAERLKSKGVVLEDVATKERFGMFINDKKAITTVAPKEIETLLIKFIFGV